MVVKLFASGPLATNAYIVYCPRTLEAAIIDPAPGSHQSIERYIKQENLVPNKILLTHSHWDHIVDVSKVKSTFSIPVYIHAEDAGNLEKPGSDGLPMMYHYDAVKPDYFLQEGDQIEVGDILFTVIHTPGHTPGGVCFYSEKEGLLFSGDTLFKGTIGNISLPTAESERMWPSLSKLAKLPKITKVYPGHGASTTIESESWLSRARELFQ